MALLAAAAVTDIETRKIPNAIPAGIVAPWLVRQALLAYQGGADCMSAFVMPIVAAVAFMASLMALTIVAEKVSGTYMFGGGDIKLLAAVALFLGIEATLVATFVACLVSLVYATARLKKGIPFAPGVLCGALMAILL